MKLRFIYKNYIKLCVLQNLLYNLIRFNKLLKMKIVAKNKKAYFDYEILTKYEAGIILLGTEIKSVRAGNVNLKGSYVVEKNAEIWAKDIHISPYKFAQTAEYNPLRQRKLLLSKKEIQQITDKLHEKSVSAVPLEFFLSKKGLAKLTIAIVRGKKKYDKRETLKQKDIDREIAHKLKQY